MPDKITVYSSRENANGFTIKEFLFRNLVKFDYHEITGDTLPFRTEHSAEDCLPAVEFPDGTIMFDPRLFTVASKIGLQQKPKEECYDLAVMGAGPAGLTAAVYGGSEGLSTVLIERHSPGGRIGSTSLVENVLGHPKGITGKEFAAASREQAEKFGVEFIVPVELKTVEKENETLRLNLSNGSSLLAKTLIIAAGVKYRLLEVPGADRLTGAGVYYGSAMTEGRRSKGKVVYVVGGANSAGQAAMYFSRFAAQVNLIIRGKELEGKMSEYLIREIHDVHNICIQNNSEIVRVNGDTYLESIDIRDTISGEVRTNRLDSLFLLIGGVPHAECVSDLILRDEEGFLLTGHRLEEDPRFAETWPYHRRPASLETNIPGVFVAGDVRKGSAKRMAAAMGDGANAIQQALDYIREMEKSKTIEAFHTENPKTN
ncbi:MAG: fused response regulator/thioredoxin-disulfide reductase [Chitinophagaceae bacterium]|nr:MAG: fused response regulator/thioredoxin-disulfide reductase [Chitinophagaceae bacterium]